MSCLPILIPVLIPLLYIHPLLGLKGRGDNDLYQDSLFDVHDQGYRGNRLNRLLPYNTAQTNPLRYGDVDDDVSAEFESYAQLKGDRFGGKRDSGKESSHPWNPPAEKVYKTLPQADRVVEGLPKEDPHQKIPKETAVQDLVDFDLGKIILRNDARLLLSLLLLDQVKNAQKGSPAADGTNSYTKNVARLYHGGNPYDYGDEYEKGNLVGDTDSNPSSSLTNRDGQFQPSSVGVDRSYYRNGRLSIPASYERKNGYNNYYGFHVPRFNPENGFL